MKNQSSAFATIYSFKIQLLLIGMLFSVPELFGQPNNKYPFQVKVSGQGQPILFIPGALCSGEVWNETVARFNKQYQCHVLTLAGYAGTPALEGAPYIESYKVGIKKYIVQNKLKKVILVGHSLGGFLGQWVASEISTEIDKLLVIDALPFLMAASNPEAKEGFNEKMATMYYNNMLTTDPEVMKKGRLAIVKGMISDSVYQQKALDWCLKTDPKTEAWTIAEMMGKDLRNNITDITCPVMVMMAYDGPMPQYPSHTKEKQLDVYASQYKAVKDLKIVSPEKSKHFIMYDQSEWFYQKMAQFIGNTPKVSRAGE